MREVIGTEDLISKYRQEYRSIYSEDEKPSNVVKTLEEEEAEAKEQSVKGLEGSKLLGDIYPHCLLVIEGAEKLYQMEHPG